MLARRLTPFCIAALHLTACSVAGTIFGQEAATNPPWAELRNVPMKGGLRAFWNVGGGDRPYNDAQAVAHGFELVNLLNTYSDYPGKQKENIGKALEGNRTNPWQKPEFFERIIRRNIAAVNAAGTIFVHDIEFPIEDDSAKAWDDPAARAASGVQRPADFAAAYYREWASWFTRPCQWAKEQFPQMPVGIYGPQPFRRDYWGLAGKSAQQIDGTHRSDAELWQFIDPAVDFCIASIYVFYDDPGSIYYMAANVEENVQRAKVFGDKPLYAYLWMRFHNSNQKLAGQELTPYLVEAMAVLPYFSGARGVVLWGFEPKLKGQYYQRLPIFLNSLGRVSDLSEKIGRATLEIDEPAHVLWKQKRPLVRKLRVAPNEWIVMAINPWQADDATSRAAVTCGGATHDLTLRGKHTALYEIRGGKVTPIQEMPTAQAPMAQDRTNNPAR